MTSAIGWLWPSWAKKGKTLNWILGCSHAGGPGCDHCWAEADTWIRQHNTNPKVARANAGLTVMRANGRVRWTGKVNRLPERFPVPFRTRERWCIFAPSKSDPWHEDLMADEGGRLHIAAGLGMMAATPSHTWVIATKRPRLGREHQRWIYEQAARNGLSPARYCMVVLADALRAMGEHKIAARVDEMPTPAWPLKNLWLLASTENQECYDARIGPLLEMDAAMHGLSIEPMLGPVTLAAEHLERLGWVICGGESGPGARPMHPDWALSLRDQCIAAAKPFFFKQWGEWYPGQIIPHTMPEHAGQLREFTVVESTDRKQKPGSTFPVAVGSQGQLTRLVRQGKSKAGNLLDGRTWEQFPPDPVTT